MMMNKATARRISKDVMDEPSDKLIDAVTDLHENRNQELETIEDIADRAKAEEHFYMIVIQEVLLAGDTTHQDLKEVNENLKEQENAISSD